MTLLKSHLNRMNDKEYLDYFLKRSGIKKEILEKYIKRVINMPIELEEPIDKRQQMIIRQNALTQANEWLKDKKDKTEKEFFEFAEKCYQWVIK